MTPQEWNEHILQMNEELHSQLKDAEDENARLWAVLDDIWYDFEATYPETSKELREEHSILRAYTIGD